MIKEIVEIAKKERWVCVGRVRGWCGIYHRTRAAAEACLKRDQRACRNLPGGNSYSDRFVTCANKIEMNDADQPIWSTYDVQAEYDEQATHFNGW